MNIYSSLVGQKFTYAYGRTGVLQQLLLRQSDVDRLLGAHDRSDVQKVFTELKMTSMVDQGIGTGDEMLKALASWVRTEVEQMAHDSKLPVFSILWIEGSGALLSYLLKQHHSLTSSIAIEPTSGVHAYDPDMLKELVEEGKEGTLPSELVTFVQDAKALENPTPQQIDARVAQFVADAQKRFARMSGSALIKKYVQHLIDLKNIRTALRQGQDEERLDALLTGGTIAVDALTGDRDAVLASIARSNLPYELSEQIRKIDGDPIALERIFADVLSQDIARMWNIPLSIEPIFAFAAIALSNIAIMRGVLIGKSNELSPQEIKRILPPFIPATHFVL